MKIRFDYLRNCESFWGWLNWDWDYRDHRGRQVGFRVLGVRIEFGFVPDYL